MADEHEKILLSFFWTPVARRNRNYWRREELICGPRFIPTMTDEIHVQISAIFFRFLCAWFDSGDRQITQLYHPVLYNFFKKGFRFFFSVHLKCGYFYFWFRSRMMNDDANWILKREQLSIDQVEIFFFFRSEKAQRVWLMRPRERSKICRWWPDSNTHARRTGAKKGQLCRAVYSTCNLHHPFPLIPDILVYSALCLCVILVVYCPYQPLSVSVHCKFTITLRAQWLFLSPFSS
jgi:hypothetical protein